MTGHDLLRDQFAYNTWANARVFGAIQGANAAHVEEEAPGTVGSITETLKHMVGVEDIYLQMLRDATPGTNGALAGYFDQSIDWFASRADALGAEYQQLLTTADQAVYSAALRVPWLDFALTKRDGLLQVLSHSAQHRAQVLSALGARGVEVPGLDYVEFVEERQSH